MQLEKHKLLDILEDVGLHEKKDTSESRGVNLFKEKDK